ncbi:MAG: hypothetical protein C0467_18580 [Planctomycetaceae bacterium]|nr:hypothetical protein [Planctomycetaceae bacterium]
MSQKRFEQDLGAEHEQNLNALVMTELARTSSESAVHKTPPKHEDEQVSVFWRVFGGTLLSMVAIGVFTLYNSISSSIAELRSELSREREARSELVKKDEFNTRTSSQYERLRSFEGLRAEHEGMKERLNSASATVDALKKDTGLNMDALKKDVVVAVDAVKKDAATIEVLKEKIVALELLKKDLVGLEILKEKLTTAAAELKLVREDLGKTQQEQERNRIADLERKTSRDVQAKHVEDSLKELQRGLQDCREKLARLEGLRGTGNSAETTPTPARSTPADTKGPGDQGTGSKPGAGEKPGGM